MKVAYSFSVLRYVHDPVSAEFINIGVALYSPEVRYLNAVCTPRYGRVSKVFEPIEGDHFRQMTRYIESRIEELGQKMKSGLPFELPIEDIAKVLAQVLPPDDSALQFSQAGGGFTSAPEKTLNELYERYVEKYTSRKTAPSRDDEDVWKVYKAPLEKLNLTQYLKPKRIIAPDYDYQFERARKNRVWHAYEPMSFDLADSSYIVEKATHWRGRMTNLADSDEKFKLHILLGQPHEAKLRDAFVKAKNILHKIPGKPEFVDENEAEQFAAELKKEIDEHGS